MSELFNDLIPKEKKIPNNIQVNESMFSDLMPSEDKHQYKITEKGNPGSNLSDEDKTEPGLFEDLIPEVNKTEPGLFNDLIPKEDKVKLEDKNNYNKLLKALSIVSPLTNLAEKTEDLIEDIDGDSSLWKKVAFATQLGFTDTYRGVKQISGIDTEKMKADQKNFISLCKILMVALTIWLQQLILVVQY